MMKLIAFFVLVASGSAAAQQCCITAFDQVDYKGNTRRYCGDASYEEFFSKDFNDKILSIKIPDCCSVTLYDGDFQKQIVDPVTLNTDTRDLTAVKMNGRVSSLKTNRTCECCVDTFDQINYIGETRRYCGDASYDAVFSKDFNDRISSIRVPECCSVTLFDADFQKRDVDPVTFYKDTADLTPYKLNNVVSSLKTASEPATVFSSLEILENLNVTISDRCKCSSVKLAPLYRAANNIKYPGSQIYAAYFDTLKALILTYNYYEQLAVSGQVSRSQEGCDGKLKAVYRLAQPWNLDRVMTTDLAVAAAFKASGYNDDSLAFYCSATKQDDCGATVPLHCYTYTGNSDGKPRHTCHTDQGEAATTIAAYGTGGTYDGILCYIWPAP